MKKLENRQTKRVQFFIVPTGEHEVRPAWVQNDSENKVGIAGMVVNMSETGIQILTEDEHTLTDAHYRISFGSDQVALPALNDCSVELVWSELTGSLHTCSGFRFVGEPPEDVNAFLARSQSQQDTQIFLRCELASLGEQSLGIHRAA